MCDICIKNARIILPEKVLTGSVAITAGRISRIYEGSPDYHEGQEIDAEGLYLMPGIIDMHSDAIEKEIQPRPNTLLPVHMAFHELEKRLASSGITTMYHSLSLSNEWGVRDSEMVSVVIDNINSYKKNLSMINHKIHLRYEITYLDGADILLDLIRSNSIDLMSYMDHTPGQGQFKDDEAYKRFTIKTYGRIDSDFETYLKNSAELRNKIDWNKLMNIALEAKEKGIALASHDDDNYGKIDTLIDCRGSISEFPINIETAIYAKNKGIYVCVGAPNIIRGKSHSSNMRAIDAVRAGACDIICSDYIPGAMLPAALAVAKENGDLPGAARMVSQNPAAALGIDKDLGSIEEGKIADMILFDICGGYPVIMKTIVGGRIVYQADYAVMKGLVPCS